jgi:hypothetical protein
MVTRFFDDGDILVYASSAPGTVLGQVHVAVLRAYPDLFGEALEARDDPGDKILLAFEPAEIWALIDGAYDGRCDELSLSSSLSTTHARIVF